MTTLTMLRPMSCGGCGHGKFCLFSSDDVIVTRCLQCGSDSIIKATKPSLAIEWGHKADGIITVMDPKS